MSVGDTELGSCVKNDRGGRPGLPVPKAQYGLSGRREAVLKIMSAGDGLCSLYIYRLTRLYLQIL